LNENGNGQEAPEVQQHLLHLLYLSELILKTRRWTVDECRTNMIKVRQAEASGRLADAEIFRLRDLAVTELTRLLNAGIALLPDKVDFVREEL
jgi:hypothetical protein